MLKLVLIFVVTGYLYRKADNGMCSQSYFIYVRVLTYLQTISGPATIPVGLF